MPSEAAISLLLRSIRFHHCLEMAALWSILSRAVAEELGMTYHRHDMCNKNLIKIIKAAALGR